MWSHCIIGFSPVQLLVYTPSEDAKVKHAHVSLKFNPGAHSTQRQASGKHNDTTKQPGFCSYPHLNHLQSVSPGTNPCHLPSSGPWHLIMWGRKGPTCCLRPGPVMTTQTHWPETLSHGQCVPAGSEPTWSSLGPRSHLGVTTSPV